MMTFINKTTGETMNVSNISMLQGRIFFTVRGKGCGQRFFNRNVCLTLDEQVENGTYLKIADGWQLVDEPKARKPRTRKVAEEPQGEPEPVNVAVEEPIIVDEPKSEPQRIEEEPAANIVTAEPAVNVVEPMMTQTAEHAEEIRAELIAKYGTMGADIFESAVKLAGFVPHSVNAEQVHDICKQYFASVKGNCMAIEVKSARGVGKIEGITCKGFQYYCNLVNAGKPLYLYGPAGCGKSYTAKQIAAALNLPYYETSQAIFAHDLKGYGDAGGNYVATPLYKAVSSGGVFFLDEVDASAPEALVVLNNLIANGGFDFPVVGWVQAHENFRVIAAGNTRMTGATTAYVARQMQDSSFKNRFFFELVGYERDMFMALTGNDEEIVNFGEDLRRAARETGIMQLFSYRQAKDLATLQECCKDDAHLLRGSVLQEKELDDTINLYEHLQDKRNRWAKAMKACIEEMRTEEVW